MPSQEYQSYIQLLNDCGAECKRCIDAGLNSADFGRLVRCIKLCTDCTLACALVASLLQADSENVGRASAFCAEVCELCAQESARFDLAACQRVAAACHRCAAECRRKKQAFAPPA